MKPTLYTDDDILAKMDKQYRLGYDNGYEMGKRKGESDGIVSGLISGIIISCIVFFWISSLFK